MRLSSLLPSLPALPMGMPAAALLALAGCGGTVPVAPPAQQTVAATATAAAAAAARSAPSPWASVQAQVGRTPADGGDFLRTGPMADRLKALLGPVNYPVLLQNMGRSGPLQQDGGLLYLIGHGAKPGGGDSAAVVLDPARDAMRVWLQTGDEHWDVQDAGPAVSLPADVRTLIGNARR